jgi:hypothetical protein
LTGPDPCERAAVGSAIIGEIVLVLQGMFPYCLFEQRLNIYPEATMSQPTTLQAVILDTVLGRLALLFLAGANGDMTEARQAARHMLLAYDPQTEDELRLATEIISFSFHALEALSQAASPDRTLSQILRLRGSAVSLSREAHKSQRKLDQLQKVRRAGISAPPAEPPQPQPRPRIDKALALVEATRQATDTTATQAQRQHQAAKRIAENLAKNQRPPIAPNIASAALPQDNTLPLG